MNCQKCQIILSTIKPTETRLSSEEVLASYKALVRSLTVIKW